MPQGKTEQVFDGLVTTDAAYVESAPADILCYSRAMVVIKELNTDAGHYKVLVSTLRTGTDWYEDTAETAMAANELVFVEVPEAWARIKIAVKDDDGIAPFASFDAFIIRKRH